MNDVKLIDFSNEELQDLLTEVVARMKVIEDANYIVVSQTKKYENLTLWRTQILNAISTVQMRDRINSN